jgi:hypothetical protein
MSERGRLSYILGSGIAHKTWRLRMRKGRLNQKAVWANRGLPPTDRQLETLANLAESLDLPVPKGMTTRGAVSDKIGELTQRRRFKASPVKAKGPEKW